MEDRLEDQPGRVPHGANRAHAHRFSTWDGTQDPLGEDADALFDRLSEDVFHGWDFETAMRRLLGQGLSLIHI